jgi:hypothetical protein
MADYDVELSILAEQLGKDLQNIAPQVEAELKAAIESVANATYAAMIAKVQSMTLDPKNRADYLRALKFESLGDGSYLIYLDGDRAQTLEEGQGPWSIKDALLKSQKIVQVGSRSGQPWVRKSKKNKKYAAVPFEHHPFSGHKSGNLGEDIKKILVKNRAGQEQPITKIFKDLGGKPIHGKVAVAGKQENPNLTSLTKYQYVHPSGKVSSIYMTYRMVSEDSPGWQHPGTKGYSLFKEAEQYVETELTNILKTLL